MLLLKSLFSFLRFACLMLSSSSTLGIGLWRSELSRKTQCPFSRGAVRTSPWTSYFPPTTSQTPRWKQCEGTSNFVVHSNSAESFDFWGVTQMRGYCLHFGIRKQKRDILCLQLWLIYFFPFAIRQMTDAAHLCVCISVWHMSYATRLSQIACSA